VPQRREAVDDDSHILREGRREGGWEALEIEAGVCQGSQGRVWRRVAQSREAVDDDSRVLWEGRREGGREGGRES